MEKGFKTLQKTASRRDRSRSNQDEEDGFNDSAIGTEGPPFRVW